jgi:small subunit ribosomal protein S16
MLTIRLARIGKKNKAQFKIMLQEKTIAPGGAHVEILGSHDPHMKKTVLKADRIKYWVSQGAQPSDTAYNLFVKNGIIEGAAKKVKMPAKKVEPVVEAAPAAPAEAPVAEAPKAE